MLERQRKLKWKQERDMRKKRVQRRNYAIGELVTKYFPEVSAFTSEAEADDQKTLKNLEAFLSALSSDKQLIKELKNRAEKSITNSSKPF